MCWVFVEEPCSGAESFEDGEVSSCDGEVDLKLCRDVSYEMKEGVRYDSAEGLGWTPVVERRSKRNRSSPEKELHLPVGAMLLHVKLLHWLLEPETLVVFNSYPQEQEVK